MIYLDSSALVKLAVTERETAALGHWLFERSESVRVTSELARVEVPRAVMRTVPTALLQAHHVVARVRKVALTAQVLDTAASLQPESLRSLDAIHLASALALGPALTTFVAYDDKLLRVAGSFGLTVASPS